MVKLRFEKATKISKIFVVACNLDFKLREDCHFEGITDVIAVLRWRQFVKEIEAIIESIVQKIYTNVPNDVYNVQGVLVSFCLFCMKSHYSLMDLG